MKSKAANLKTGQAVWMAGMVMQFSHFDNGTPVFTHFKQGYTVRLNGKLNRCQVNHVDRRLTKESEIEII